MTCIKSAEASSVSGVQGTCRTVVDCLRRGGSCIAYCDLGCICYGEMGNFSCEKGLCISPADCASRDGSCVGRCPYDLCCCNLPQQQVPSQQVQPQPTVTQQIQQSPSPFRGLPATDFSQITNLLISILPVILIISLFKELR